AAGPPARHRRRRRGTDLRPGAGRRLGRVRLGPDRLPRRNPMTMTRPLHDVVKDLAAFSDDAWAKRLNALTTAELNKFCEKKQYTPALDRVRDLARDLKARFVARDELIELMIWASIAQLPMLLLGEWGTAKSLLVRRFAEGLGISSQTESVDREDD